MRERRLVQFFGFSLSKFSLRAAALLFCLLYASGAIRAQQAGKQAAKSAAAAGVEQEIQRLEQDLASLHSKDADDAAAIREARQALRSGYLYASLYDLQSAWVDVVANRYVHSTGDMDKAGLPAFEKEWQRAGTDLAAAEQRFAAMQGHTRPAAVQALMDAAELQSKNYYQSARLYGQETTVGNGLYYIGAAKGYLDFATACAEVHFPELPAWQARPVGADIAALEKAVLEAYSVPGATAQQSRYNQVSSSLKLAGELDQQGKSAAALQNLMDAALYFARVDGSGAKAATRAGLLRQSTKFQQRLSAGRADNSIGEMYWQLAQAGLHTAKAEGSSAGGVRQAGALFSGVLPRYFQYLERPEAAVASASMEKAPGKVTVTLVRWPDT